jgi:hypothetical protein
VTALAAAFAASPAALPTACPADFAAEPTSPWAKAVVDPNANNTLKEAILIMRRLSSVIGILRIFVSQCCIDCEMRIREFRRRTFVPPRVTLENHILTSARPSEKFSFASGGVTALKRNQMMATYFVFCAVM